ncbi:AMP-binding enzyme [Haladaptatus sp. NG-WS-4]
MSYNCVDHHVESGNGNRAALVYETADVVDDEGKSIDVGKEGALVLEQSFPDLTQTLWESHDRYLSEYWQEIEGKYYVGDAASMDEEGYIWFSGRADEVLTIAGHRIGPTDIEDALVSHAAVVEAAVIGKPHPEKTEVAAVFITLADEYNPSDDLRTELIDQMHAEVGKIAVIGNLEFVHQLPKTRSGKIMRRTIRDILLDEDLGDVSTMEDSSAVDCIKAATGNIEVESE